MLTREQLDDYRNDGLLFLPALFEADEIDALNAEKARIFSLTGAAHLRAASGEYLGTTAMDRVSELYARLLCDERLLSIGEQILGPELYCHQYKIILKEPFGELSLPWHQDYAPWRHHDGMPAANALSIGIFLDEVSEFNGPITYIPESHRHGLIDYEVIDVPGTTPIPSLPDATVARLVAAGGLVAPKGPAGSVTVFDSCTAHASGQNLSPFPRHLIYLSYNPAGNAITAPTRPDHFANRDFSPLVMAPVDRLLR
ncbi:MAG: phytanoyl-CoA dioxygenase family protein [Gammaproteobacteria bacterium]|jgi:ectoine hydroxylase